MKKDIIPIIIVNGIKLYKGKSKSLYGTKGGAKKDFNFSRKEYRKFVLGN